MVSLTKLAAYLTCRTEGEYKSLSKKDDNFGLEEAKSWIQQHPLNLKIKKYNYIEINKYAHSVIKELKDVPINSSNQEIIKGHLIALAKQNNLLQQKFIKYISKINADQKTIDELKVSLICTCSD